MLLWTTDVAMNPTFRNFTDSFETWAYRNGLLKELQRLEEGGLIERQQGLPGDRIYRLAEAGRLQALGGRDPIQCWNRPWDGLWRLAAFDVPEISSTKRDKIRGYLRSSGFGYLQNSVWISPDPLDEQRAALIGGSIDVGTLILLETRPCGGETDAQIVACAWDFEKIGQLYEKCRAVLERPPAGEITSEAAAKVFQSWLREEREAWTAAISRDPLLPSRLLPKGYPGKVVWNQRIEILVAAAEQMRRFKL